MGLLVIISIVGLLLLIEVGLRIFPGLGKRPLYLADDKIGYLLAPNQKLRRFGNSIIINQYSLRNQNIEQKRLDTTLRILLVGDSIVNGGWWTDQSQTLSSLIEQQLTPLKSSPVEVLNASANSWGPRHQLAYLQQFGTFESQIVVLVINTDDLFATTPTPLPVGRDRNYPARQPSSAIEELLERVFYRPQPLSESDEKIQVKEPDDRVGTNLTAIEGIKAIATQNKAQFLLAITPLLREVDDSDPREYEKEARIRLKNWAESNNISLIDFLPPFRQEESAKSLYRDHIHLSPKGNQIVSDTLTQTLISRYTK